MHVTHTSLSSVLTCDLISVTLLKYTSSHTLFVAMDNSVTQLPYRAPSTSVSLETRSTPVLNEYSKLLPLLPVENN